MYDYRVFEAQAAPRSHAAKPQDLSRVDLHALVARGRVERSRMAAHLLTRLAARVRRLVAGGGASAA
jgi:hypothetical protein